VQYTATDFKYIDGRKNVDLVRIAQDTDKLGAVVNKVMNLLLPKKESRKISSLPEENIVFSKRTVS
jgi:hypothetical protein